MAGEENPIWNIIGERAALGPRRRDLLPLYLQWINDFETARNLEVRIGPVTLEAEEEWYERTSRSERDANFTIYERATARPIGNTSLHDVNLVHRTAEFGIMIGECDYRGQGYGTEVTRLMLDYGFTALGLHNIMLRVWSFNVPAQRCYVKAGFRPAGRRREATRLAGEPYDVLYMDCLASEWQSPVLRRWLVPELPPDPASHG